MEIGEIIIITMYFIIILIFICIIFYELRDKNPVQGSSRNPPKKTIDMKKMKDKEGNDYIVGNISELNNQYIMEMEKVFESYELEKRSIKTYYIDGRNPDKNI